MSDVDVAMTDTKMFADEVNFSITVQTEALKGMACCGRCVMGGWADLRTRSKVVVNPRQMFTSSHLSE